MNDAPVSPILRGPAVLSKTGLSRSALYALMGKGEFPRPVKLTKKSVGWPQHVVDQWLSTRETSAGAGQAAA